MTMNSYATASVDCKDSIACLQSYHRAAASGGFVDYGRLYQTVPSQSSAAAAVYLDQYRLQQAAAAYPATVGDHPASAPYTVGGKTTPGAGYDQAPVGYGFFNVQDTFRRDQWSLLGSAVQDGGANGLKRCSDSSSGEKTTSVTRPCGGGGAAAGDVERSAGIGAATTARGGGSTGGISALVDSVQIKCEDGSVRSTHHHHHQQQQQHHQQHSASSRGTVTAAGCSPTKHHHKHAADSIKSSKGIKHYHNAQLIHKRSGSASVHKDAKTYVRTEIFQHDDRARGNVYRRRSTVYEEKVTKDATPPKMQSQP